MGSSLLEKRIFDPVVTHFYPKTAPLQRILGFSRGQNASPRAQNGLKTLVGSFQMVEGHFWKNAFWTHFRPIFGLETAHFQGILRFSQNAPQRA